MTLFTRLVLHPILQVKLIAVTSTAAHAHAVWLVEFSVIAAVVALQEGLLHPLHRQVETPVLPVDGEVDIAAKRGIHTKVAHHLIGEIVLHIGVVLDNVVEADLIQAVVVDGAVIVVKLHFETISVVAIAGHLGQRGISFGPDGHILIALVVDDQVTQDVLLVGAALQEPLPVVHDNVNGMDPGGIETGGSRIPSR